MIRHLVLPKAWLLAAVLCALGPPGAGPAAAASAETFPEVVREGFDKYAFSGPEAALKFWFRDGAGSRQQELEERAAFLHGVQAYGGKFVGYHVVASRRLAPSTQLMYLVIDFERTPVFARFLLYLYKNEWRTTSVVFDTEPENVYPPGLLE